MSNDSSISKIGAMDINVVWADAANGEYIYSMSKLNPPTTFSTTNRFTLFKYIFLRSISNIVTKTSPISKRIFNGYSLKKSIPFSKSNRNLDTKIMRVYQWRKGYSWSNVRIKNLKQIQKNLNVIISTRDLRKKMPTLGHRDQY